MPPRSGWPGDPAPIFVPRIVPVLTVLISLQGKHRVALIASSRVHAERNVRSGGRKITQIMHADFKNKAEEIT
jgi:hypothetical protein